VVIFLVLLENPFLNTVACLVVKRFAVDVVGPKVREMDENENMDPEIIKGLFDQGVRFFIHFVPHFLRTLTSEIQLMGIETSSDHGGAESSFTAAIIAVEELAKIDPSVSVMCDVHNTLVNTVLRTYGTQKQKDEWLPRLAQDTVNPFSFHLGHKRTTEEKR
jgi:short/branched chain acyl-CoA dehydrogenase